MRVWARNALTLVSNTTTRTRARTRTDFQAPNVQAITHAPIHSRTPRSMLNALAHSLQATSQCDIRISDGAIHTNNGAATAKHNCCCEFLQATLAFQFGIHMFDGAIHKNNEAATKNERTLNAPTHMYDGAFSTEQSTKIMKRLVNLFRQSLHSKLTSKFPTGQSTNIMKRPPKTHEQNE